MLCMCGYTPYRAPYIFAEWTSLFEFAEVIRPRPMGSKYPNMAIAGPKKLINDVTTIQKKVSCGIYPFYGSLILISLQQPRRSNYLQGSRLRSPARRSHAAAPAPRRPAASAGQATLGPEVPRWRLQLLPSCFVWLLGLHACVCVCHPLMAKRTYLHFASSSTFPFNRTGPEAHRQDSGQRRRLSAECKAIWDARLCTCSLYRAALQTVGIDLSRAVSVCVCVCVCLFVCVCVCARPRLFTSFSACL